MDIWIIDEGAYRIYKNVFMDKEEAIQKASESARILGRPIGVYRVVDRNHAAENTHPTYDKRIQSAGWVNPDGSWEEGVMPTQDHRSHTIQSPAILGSVLDDVADALEHRGEFNLSSQVDASVEEIYAVAVQNVLDKLPKYAQKMLDRGDYNNDDLHDAIGRAVLEVNPRATKRDISKVITDITGVK